MGLSVDRPDSYRGSLESIVSVVEPSGPQRQQVNGIRVRRRGWPVTAAKPLRPLIAVAHPTTDAAAATDAKIANRPK